MTRPAVLVDRLALVLCALGIDVALAWIVFHPAAAAVLQISLVAIVVVWRFELHHHSERVART